jgi:predicted metal-binding protein
VATGVKLRLRSNWQQTILVCSKCSKRIDGGFGDKGRTPLAKALRKHLRLKKGRKAAAGIVEVKCLGVCPASAVTVVNAAKAGEWLLVRAGSDLDELAGELGLSESSPYSD